MVEAGFEGGFGFVYVGRHMQSNDEYAVKRMIVQDRDSQQQAQAAPAQPAPAEPLRDTLALDEMD